MRWTLLKPTTNVPYYESIDLDDAHHPQTFLAYELNDQWYAGI